MRIGGTGYDPFWGVDMFRYVERDKIVWEKPRPLAISVEDEEKFFGNVLKTVQPSFQQTGIYKKIDIKV